MPELTISTPGPMAVTVHVGTLIREAIIERDRDEVAVTMGNADVGARFTGPRSVILAMLIDAADAVQNLT